ncbi:methionine-S-sulfoxide reductase [Hoeflea phototrophica DFL-43]|jgi:peptide-methionine (S)-S-oxide reductase|uniref:Peptide methionine sulfoxide reductase MsrA n=2 Tax=Hoeflea TaxID=274591 RepID=A9DG26_HOEPD|nr:peptide-methionine (S)-S-oxide reductase MsrA [Hoeflea phototrophica]EDQ31705.1 methionine-S-sulfoxide reductase [Hoeflea phototrophica DFL-43]
MRRLLPATIMLALSMLTAGVARAQDDATAAEANTGVAIFAGGCFWCVESDFDHIEGVKETVSGYIGGKNDNPTYETHTRNGDREAVRITYDPSMVSYDALLKTFFRTVDPTDDGGQFCDRGFSYSTAVYTLNDAQGALAEAAKADAAMVLAQPVATEVLPAPTFWPAEEYHQNFHAKNPIRYRYYRNGCGRDKRVKSLWGDQAYSGIDKK